MSRGGSGRPRGRKKRTDDAVPLDSGLPLEALDRALDPVRRVVADAVRSGQLPHHAGAAITANLLAAARSPLPEPVTELLSEMVVAVAVADEGAGEPDDDALGELFSTLARLDAVMGLLLHQEVEEPKKRPYLPQSASDGVARSDSTETSPKWTGRWDVFVDDVLHDTGLDETIEELLGRLPTSFEMVGAVQGAGRSLPIARVAVGGRLGTRVTVCHPDGSRIENATIEGAGPLRCAWANKGPHPSLTPTGGRVVLVGDFDGEVLRESEVAVPCPDGMVRLARYGDGDNRGIREAITRLGPVLKSLRDPVSDDTLRRLGLMDRGAAAGVMHAEPMNEGERAEQARRRMAFDEALLAALGAGARRHQDQQDRGFAHTLLQSAAAGLDVHFDLRLSDTQQLAYEDIKRDLRRGTPMRRVLNGEVGGGKGSVALASIVTVAEAKGQVLVLGPDDAEIDNRFMHSEPLLKDLGFVARRLPDAPTGAVLQALKRGEVHVVFGTHRLLDAQLPFRRLGLVVSTERFPFGNVSAHNTTRTPRPDVLVLAQIPVGSRVLCTAYADCDVSMVSNTGRTPAQIELCRAAERSHAYESLRSAVARGQQGVVLFPRVRGRDALDYTEARRVVRALSETELAGLRVSLLHGEQSMEERRRVFSDVVHRRSDVLVTTTAMEDGPTVPGLTSVLIEQADHVEQWRLHRVIGFLSATPLPSVAVLVVGEHADADAEARLQRVLDAPDGYALTEARVQLRGIDACVLPGASPLATHRLLDFDRDRDLILAAREEAHRILRADPNLRRGSHQELAAELRNAWDALWPAQPDWTYPFSDEGSPDRRRRRRRRRRK